MTNVYIADSHFSHANIIKYCDRPFKTAKEMDSHMWDIIKKFDTEDYRIHFLGDWGFEWPEEAMDGFKNWQNHVMVYGNHDSERPGFYKRWFGTIVGSRHTWKEHRITITDGDSNIVLSHEPQRHVETDYVNIYGHHHNNMTRYPEKFKKDYGWIFGSKSHFNVGVELIDYTPKTITEVLSSQLTV